MSVYNNLLDAVVSAVTDLNLTFTPEGNGQSPIAANVVRRKLPRVEEDLGDQLPMIAVCIKDTPEKIEPASAEEETGVFKWYLVEVVIIAAGNQDFISDQPELLRWRQQIMRSFLDPVPIDVTEIVDTDVIPEVPLDRAKLNSNYDYSGMAIRFRCIEPRNIAAADAIGAS